MMESTATRLRQGLPALHCFLIAVALSLATFRFFFTDANDRYRCHALLNDGEWLDKGLTSPTSLNNWQPDGCMLANYNPAIARPCLAGRRLVFVGDSTARQLYYATAKQLDPSLAVPDYATSPPKDGNAAAAADKHKDIAILAGEAEFQFVWDPYLNGTVTESLLKSATRPPKNTQIPALLVFGSGLWQLKNPSSGGQQAWMDAVNRILAAASPSPGHSQIADEIVVLPVQQTIQAKLSPDRRPTMTNAAIDAMNAQLALKLPPFTSSSAISQLSVPYVFNAMLDNPQAASYTVDGVHFTGSIMKAQANVLLNLRCNDVLPKKFPFDKTCCSQYPAPNWLQAVILLFILIWAPLGTHFVASKGKPFYSHFFPPQHVLLPMTIFGFSVIFMYFCDRTSLFLKIQKQFDFWQFTIANLLALALGLGTMKKPEKDLGFLNRDQTDEWKGWMQIAILIYHYYGASKISGVYNPIRVCVAAYLFMSGYGHFFFYYKKADFGLARVAAVLVRLNLLTLVLAYVQDTDYLSYYFSPLTTLWFGVIWVTMYVGHNYNKNTFFMLGKLALSSLLMTAFHFLDFPLAAVFGVFNTLFATQWNATEWTFRVTLDMWIVYVGMLAAFAFIKIGEYKLWEREWWPRARQATIVAAAVTMAGYFGFELQYNKFEYNHFHPFIAMFPVLAFTVLRNATPFLRSTSSKAYIWIGQCSLETFICQFHLWLAADTKGLLVLLPFPRLRFLNMIFTTLVFLFLSNQIAKTTGDITDWLLGKQPKAKKPAGLPTVNPASASASAGTGPASSSDAAYVPLTTLNAPDVSSGPSSPSLTEKPQLAEGRFAQAMKSLHVRCLAIMALIWVINLLYPTAHPSHGHLLPTH